MLDRRDSLMVFGGFFIALMGVSFQTWWAILVGSFIIGVGFWDDSTGWGVHNAN